MSNAEYRTDSVLTDVDHRIISSYMQTHQSSEEHNDERFLFRAKYFKQKQITRVPEIKEMKMHNHLINNYVLGNKKALFNTMANYYRDNKK